MSDVKEEALAVRQIDGNVTLTTREASAWFLLGPQTRSFTTDGAKAHMLLDFGRRLTNLVGTPNIHIRVTSRPYPVSMWAEGLNRDTLRNATAPLPGCDGNTWIDYLTNTQKHLGRATLAEKEVYIGVPVMRRPLLAQWGERFTRQDARDREWAAIQKKAAKITTELERAGTDADPATMQQMEWLMYRSVGLLMPPPKRLPPPIDAPYEASDMTTFTDRIMKVSDRPYAPTTRIIYTDPNGNQIERHVAVLTLGRIAPIRHTDDPWMQLTDRLPFPTEWSARLNVIPGRELVGEVQHLLDVMRDQEIQYVAHDKDVPRQLAEQRSDGARIIQEMSDSDTLISTRVHGWWRLAISGRTADECLDRVGEAQELYANHNMTLEHPRAQWGKLAEFIPGEPLSDIAHERRMPVLYAAASLPQTTASIGDREGDYVGVTQGVSQRPVFINGHIGMERLDRSGVFPLVSEPGGGKSITLGGFFYNNLRRGVLSTLLDPSGPLGGLASLPELRSSVRHVDLMRGEPGSLSAGAVIPDPLRSDYADDDKWKEATIIASMDRRQLLSDQAMRLLPADWSRMRETHYVIAEAVRMTKGRRDTSGVEAVADNLRKVDAYTEHARQVSRMLRDIGQMPQARLFFPTTAEWSDEWLQEPLGLILTMDGIVLPDPFKSPDDYTVEEQLSAPLLAAAIFNTTRRIYGRPRDERKFVGFDEVGAMGQWKSGSGLFTRLGVDSRKWNAVVMPSSQNPEHVLGLNIHNLIGGALVGRIESERVAGDALELLGIQRGVGYEQVIQGLSPLSKKHGGRRKHREFIYRDAWSRCERIRWDMSHIPHVLDAIGSTPGMRPAEPTAPVLAGVA